ncbi:hypothetical protein [Natribacillus halophilus]|uniref:hypothetical protein n=1 Tax=Natribacillus halophilus TaxID=549003 RepID=UPI00115F9F72|nr:hypothetical protein [Natribacillus halophilus]
MANKEKKWAIYVTAGSVSALVSYLLFNKRARSKTVSCVRESKAFVSDASAFVTENRQEISDLVKGTTERVNELVQVAGEDIEQIARHSAHLKDTATDVLDTAKEAGQDIQRQRQAYKIREGQTEQRLPGAD